MSTVVPGERLYVEDEGAWARHLPLVDDDDSSRLDPISGIRSAIESQVASEDHQTHYQLGIGFKEMGMLDEAIGEFQMASRDRDSFVACSSMLGLCFREKGMPQIADEKPAPI